MSESLSDAIMLYEWEEIKDQYSGSAILLGNGASVAIWKGFKYSSLFDVASSKISDPLGVTSRDLFNLLDTRNFEWVLSAIKQSENIGNAMGFDLHRLDAIYEEIRTALFQAIAFVHVPWGKLEQSNILSQVSAVLSATPCVFTTNYDLLAYWSIMKLNGDSRHEDFFRPNNGLLLFDVSNANRSTSKAGLMYFLHGAIHLGKNPPVGLES
jgi:hypothetical protein